MSVENRLTRSLLALTFVTGIVDAISFLGLGQVFAAMQTGNVIFLGFGIAGADAAPVLAPLLGIGAFVAGGGLGALLTGPGSARVADLRPAMAAEVALLGCAALVAGLTEVSPGALSAYTLIAMLSFAMGLRNTAVRRLESPNLATTVLNLTLTSATSPLPAGVARGSDLVQRSAALIAILLGATTGALLLKTSLFVPIALATAIALAVLAQPTTANRRHSSGAPLSR